MRAMKHMGLWWLPDEPDKQLTGTLDADGVSRATLSLFGRFREANMNDQASFRPEVILGLAEDGTLITLCYCHEAKNTMRFGGISVSGFDVGLFVTGQHFNTVDEIRFRSIAGALQHLGDWTCFDPVRVQVTPPSRQGPLRLDLHVQHLGPLKVMAGDIEVTIGVNVEQQFKPMDRYAVVLHHWITITPPNSIGIEDYFKLMHAAQTFIALGLRWPTQLDDVLCRTTKSESHRPDVNLHYAVIPSRLAGTWSGHSKQHNFLRTNIGPRLGDCLGLWLAMPPALDTVRSLYFSRMYAEATYSENDYLNLVQALEAFHRETRGGRFLSKAQWTAVSRSLWALFDRKDLPVNDRQRTSLKQRISSLPEHNLGSRLDSLLEEFKSFIDEFIPDREKFIRLVLQMRNYWTHFDSKRAAGQLAVYEQHILTLRLEALMELCWMQYADIPTEVMAEVARKCKERVAEVEWLNRPTPRAAETKDSPANS